MKNEYFSAFEQEITDRFLESGFVVVDVEDSDALERIRSRTVAAICNVLGIRPPGDAASILNSAADYVSVGELNNFRIAVHAALNEVPESKPDYFKLARTSIVALVGNELAMQRRINLSIQLPGDDSSLLPVHSDVWSGCSPFEIVLWLPLVDCYKTKSMFILPRPVDRKVQCSMHQMANDGAGELFTRIQDDILFLDVPFGKAVLFAQAVMHGNVVNQEAETRWSLNCRFKNLFSPYSDKKLGEYYEPITVRAASSLGMEYQLPEGFDD